MGILDRTRDALRPANSLEQATAPERPAREREADPAPSAPARAADERGTARVPKPAAFASEPEAIARSYFVEERRGERRYYDDYRRQALAMRATATAIRSKREDLTTIRAMLTLAEARGWQALEVKGTAAFKREAWIEAQALGLEARGYRASDPDRQEAQRRRAERGLDNRVQAPTPESRPPEPARGAPAPADKNEPKPVKTEPYPIGLSGDPQVRRAQSMLSPDAQLVVAALDSKIERQMRRQNARVTAELKAFVTTELLNKERAQGPVELSPAQRRAVATPAPAPRQESPAQAPARRREPDAPRRTLSR